MAIKILSEKDKRKRQIYLNFLNRGETQYDKIPPVFWKIFKDMDYRKFIEPLIWEDKPNMSVNQLLIKYGITEGQLKLILYRTKNSPFRK